MNLFFKHTFKLINEYLVFHKKLFFNIYLNEIYILKKSIVNYYVIIKY
jgi:hypothetical protein